MSHVSVRHRLETLSLRTARALLGVVPEPAALRLGALAGLFIGGVVRFRRRDVDRHLEWAFPDRDRAWRRRTARASYAHLGREAVVVFRLGGWSPERVLERTSVVGFEAFREAAQAGNGVVLLTGHLGSWEMGGAAIAARGIDLDVVGKGMTNPSFQDELFTGRERAGMRVIEMGDAARQVPRSLGAGKVVALLGDQNAHGGGVFLPFFGKLASTARGPALFAVRSGAPIFVAFALRDPGEPQRYTVSFRPLPFTPTGSLDGDVRAILSAYGEALEAAIRSAPEQYFWQHRRWKKRPVEEPESTGPVISP